MILLWIIIPLFIFYSILLLYYWRSWLSIPDFKPSPTTASTKISVIIPARNEERYIRNVLDSLERQSYPKWLFDIIVIDDHSTDSTASIVQKEYPVTAKLISSEGNTLNSFKKKALETGIKIASGDLIVTTDADCEMGSEWLTLIDQFKQEKEFIFIAAPVVINCNSSIVQSFQALDFMVLQGITAASVHKGIHSMCNGANLAYQKNAFYEVGGFSGIDNIASGDDMLLMHKFWKKYPRNIHYLKSKEVIVSTQPVKSWKEFFEQRIRWASKARHYDDKRIVAILILVYLFNLSFFALFIGGFWDHRYWICLLVLLVLKTIIEFPFFRSLANFFNKQWAIKWFFFFQPLHILYTVAAGFLGQVRKYEWKGRKVK